MKPLLIGVPIITLAAFVFSMVSGGGGLAAAITGVNGTAKSCIIALNERDGTELTAGDFEIEYARINVDSQNDVILKNISDSYCGSAGCVFELCLVSGDSVELLPFSYAGNELEVLATQNDQMYDIALTGKTETRLVWDFGRYITER